MKTICPKCKELVYFIWYLKRGYWCPVCMQYSNIEELSKEKIK